MKREKLAKAQKAIFAFALLLAGAFAFWVGTMLSRFGQFLALGTSNYGRGDNFSSPGLPHPLSYF